MKKLILLLFCFITLPLSAQDSGLKDAPAENKPAEEAEAKEIDFTPINKTAREHLINLINIDTSHPEPNEILAARYIYKILNKNKIDWDIYRVEKPRANLIAVLKADKDAAKANPLPALIMISHLDTVAVQGTWATPPTKATLKDGRIFGLGSTDAKNYAAINLTLLTWLKQNNIKLNRDIIFLFTADEENGSNKGIKFLYDKHPERLKAGYALNEGGGFIEEAVGLTDIMFVEAASKMYMDILVTAYGDAAHAATPGQSNAIYRLSQALSAIEAHQPQLHATPFTMRFFEKILPLQDDDAKTTMSIFLESNDYAQREQAARIISDDPFFKTQLIDTISPTILTSGAEANTVSSEAHANLNCRLLPDTNPMQFFANLSTLFENDDNITLTIIERPELPFPQPDPYSNDNLFRAIEKAVETTMPGALTLAGIGPASNESEFLRRNGVTTYGIGPRMDKNGEGPHQVDESILEEDFFKQLKLTFNILLNFVEVK